MLLEAESGKIPDINKVPPAKVYNRLMYLYRLQINDDKDYLRDMVSGFKKAKKYLLCNGNLTKEYYYMYEKGIRICNAEKSVFSLTSSAKRKGSIVLIRYLGDESHFKARPHGNSKSGKNFVTSMRGVKERLKEAVKSKLKPTAIYHKDIRDMKKNLDEDYANLEPVSMVRDTKQVKNFRTMENIARRLDLDEVAAICLMASVELGEFVKQIQVFPSLQVLLADTSVLEFAKLILKESWYNDSLPQLLNYDTTFNLGDTYVSVLIMRNIFMEKDPLFPVVYLLHDFKTEEAHKYLWRFAWDKLEMAKYCEKIPVATDREKAIVNAIKDIAPNVHLIHCQNHIISDVRQWIQKHIKDTQTENGIRRQIEALLEQDNVYNWDHLYNKYYKTWPRPFAEYFEKHVVEDLRISSRYNFSKFAAFRNVVPTSNLSESENARIKRFTENQELPIDTLSLVLHQLQLQKLSEFHRSFGPAGNYKPKKAYESKQKYIKLPFYVKFDEIEFAKLLKREVEALKSTLPQINQESMKSKHVLAGLLASHQYVTLNSASRSFSVNSPFDENKVSQVRFNNNTRRWECTCPAKRSCYHIETVLISINFTSDGDKKPSYKLSSARQSTRKTIGKAGRKKPRLGDDEFTVFPADDSIQNHESLDENSFYQDKIFEQEELDRMEEEFDRMKEEFDRKPSQDNFQKEDSDGEVPFCPPKFNSTPLPRKSRNRNINQPDFNEDNPEVLEANEWMTDTQLEDCISTLLKISNKGVSVRCCAMVFPNWVTRSKMLDVTNYCGREEFLDADVILQPINTDRTKKGSHWLLGVILVRLRVIALFDSLKPEPNARLEEFRICWVIASCMAAGGHILLEQANWKFLVSTDISEQDDGHSCGDYLLKTVAKILGTRNCQPKKGQNLRDWVNGLLKKSIEVNNREKNRKQNSNDQQRRKITASEKVAEKVRQFANLKFEMEPEYAAVFPIIRTAMEKSAMNQSICGVGKLCKKGCKREESESCYNWSMCIVCGLWFHNACDEGMQILRAPEPEYIFCSKCYPG